MPAVTSGEVSRVVYSATKDEVKSVIRRRARVGQQYSLKAACVARIPGRILGYEVRSAETGDSDNVLAAGELTCDGSVMEADMTLPRAMVLIDLGPGLADVISAYAVVGPS